MFHSPALLRTNCRARAASRSGQSTGGFSEFAHCVSRLLSAGEMLSACRRFYIRRLALRIPTQGLACSALLLMIIMPIFVGMGVWAAYQAFSSSGSAEQAIGFGLLAFLGLVVCEICRMGLLVWFNKSFS